MKPYSRPKLSDLYTLSRSKLLENHTLHSGTYLYTQLPIKKEWASYVFHFYPTGLVNTKTIIPLRVGE